MSQITLYLDQDTATRLKQMAVSEGISQSQWVARLIRERTAREWPDTVKALAGAWVDSKDSDEMPTAEEIREAAGTDMEREPF
ncbi:MAG: CopG family transcriptional regulator [Thiohalocapsa sp.]